MNFIDERDADREDEMTLHSARVRLSGLLEAEEARRAAATQARIDAERRLAEAEDALARTNTAFTLLLLVIAVVIAVIIATYLFAT